VQSKNVGLKCRRRSPLDMECGGKRNARHRFGQFQRTGFN
jgi:hypothetical protein